MPTESGSRMLEHARVYLSGPMDYVASRADERRYGWRNRVGEFLRNLGATVFDPWSKPAIHGLYEYGKEDENTIKAKESWTFEQGAAGASKRAACAEMFWPALHIDLRMVDTADFVVAYCPTNVYSVGTPHEIIMARQQHKPVLFVSPPVAFPALAQLRAHLAECQDRRGIELLNRLETEVPIKTNPKGVPSLWYMPLIGGESFFDGFGFVQYARAFGWNRIPLDENEERCPPTRPLLPFLEELNERLPMKWNRHLCEFMEDDDWLLWELSHGDQHGV